MSCFIWNRNYTSVQNLPGAKALGTDHRALLRAQIPTSPFLFNTCHAGYTSSGIGSISTSSPGHFSLALEVRLDFRRLPDAVLNRSILSEDSLVSLAARAEVDSLLHSRSLCRHAMQRRSVA